MKLRYYAYTITAIAIALGLAFLGSPAASDESGSIESQEPIVGSQVGNSAPDFTLKSTEGDISLSDFRGEKVILNFWATWCPFCVDEMPLLDRVAEERGAELLFINLQENEQTANEFAERIGVKSTILFDPNSEAKRKYNVFTQPVTYFINED